MGDAARGVGYAALFVQITCVGAHASKGLVEGQHHPVARPDVLPVPAVKLSTGFRGGGHKRGPLGQGGDLWPAVGGEKGRLDFDFNYDVPGSVAVGAKEGDVGTLANGFASAGKARETNGTE